MSGIVAFDDLFPLKADPTTLDRVFGFDSEDGKSRGFTIQSILDLISATPPAWGDITGKPSTFAPAPHSWGSHTGVSPDVDTAPDGRLVKKIGGVWAPWIPDFLTSETDPTVPAWVKAITEAEKANWNSAFGWGNHAGQYRPVAWVPAWGDVTGKPSTFAPSAHTLASHSDAAALAAATEGQLVRKAAIGWDVFTPDYYSPSVPPPPDASVPDFVRDFTIGQFAGYEAKMLEFSELPDGTIPLIKDGIPADSQMKGIYSENPFDPESEEEDYEAFVAELLYLISAKRIKGVAGVDSDDYVVKSQIEPPFSKGNLVAGTNVTLDGTLTGRLVGSGDVVINSTGGGGGGGTSDLTDLTTFPAIPFNSKYRYSHEMAGPVELSVDMSVPRVFPNYTILYIKADGTNKPTFKTSDNFSVLLDGWNNTAGEWNRIRVEWCPGGYPVAQIMDTSGASNPGTGATVITLTFDEDSTGSHVITGTVSLAVDSTDAEYAKHATYYFMADGTNKPMWASPIECNFDNYVNTAGVWNRFYLEWTPENKVTLQIQNT